LQIIKLTQQYWKLETFFLLLVIAFLSLYPLPNLPAVAGTDKTLHLVAYFFLAFPLGLKKHNNWILFIILFIVFGGIIELIQPYVNRHGEWLDFLANIIGITLGFLAGLTLNKSLIFNS